MKDAIGTSRERQRRKRDGNLLVAGLCLPKALAPILPFYLQVPSLLTNVPPVPNPNTLCWSSKT